MTISNPKRLGALILAAAFAAAACSGSGASTAPIERRRPAPPDPRHEPRPGRRSRAPSSSTAPARSIPITEAVAEEFKTVQPGVDVTVAESGTGGGFKKFCIGETDINDASRPIKEDDEAEGTACKTNGVTYVQLQVAIDGLTVVVNPENTWATCLTLEQLDDHLRPGLAREPDLEGRSTRASRTSRSSATCRAPTPGRSTTSPRPSTARSTSSTSYATQSEDDNVLVTGVAGDVNAISYFGYAYYVENTDKLKAVEIDGGSGCVAPTDETIGDDSYAPLSRPLFIYPNTAKAAEEPGARRPSWTSTSPTPPRWPPRSATSRSRTTLAAAAAGRLERRRPAVAPLLARRRPGRLGTARGVAFVPDRALG